MLSINARLFFGLFRLFGQLVYEISLIMKNKILIDFVKIFVLTQFHRDHDNDHDNDNISRDIIADT